MAGRLSKEYCVEEPVKMNKIELGHCEQIVLIFMLDIWRRLVHFEHRQKHAINLKRWSSRMLCSILA